MSGKLLSCSFYPRERDGGGGKEYRKIQTFLLMMIVQVLPSEERSELIEALIKYFALGIKKGRKHELAKNMEMTQNLVSIVTDIRIVI